MLLTYNALYTLALVLGTYFKYVQYLRWHTSRGLLNAKDTLFGTGWWKKMVFEQTVLLLSPSPFFSEEFKYEEYVDMYQVTIEYSVNDILLCLSFLRAFTLLRFILV